MLMHHNVKSRIVRRALLCAVALATGVTSTFADFSVTNGNFQQTTAQSTDISSWFNYQGADPGAWWMSAWQGPVASFNGTSIFGLSGDPSVGAWAYQSVGLNDTARSTVDLQFDVGMFSDAGETRDLGVMVQLYQTDGTFAGADGLDIVGATGATLIDSLSTTTGAITASQFQRKTLSLNLASANPTGEFFVRFANFNGGTGVGDPWTMIDNIKFITTPIHVPVDLTWVGSAAGGTWDMGTTADFSGTAGASIFLEADRPTFGNSGAVNSEGVSVVNMPSGVDTGSTVIDSSHDYLFQGAGGATGLDGSTLTKRGTGKVTFANESGNTFMGGVSIEAGTVELTGLNNGASHGINGGAIVNNGTIISNRQYANSTDINEWNPLTISQDISGTGNIVIKNHTFIGEAGQGPKNNTFTGAVTIESGFVYLGDVNGLGSMSAGTTVLSGGTLAVVDEWHLGANAVIAEPLTLNGAGVVSWFGGGNPSGALFSWEGARTFSGSVHLASTSSINTRGTSVLTLSGPLTAAAGAGLEKFGDGTLKINGATMESLTVWGGTIQQTAGTSKVKALVIEAGIVDVTNTSVAIDYVDGATPFADLVSKVTSSVIVTTSGTNYVVGVVDNATLASPLTSFGSPAVSVDASTVLVRGTLKGDSNLSGNVNFDDLLLLAQNYDPAGTGKVYAQGDTNYDGAVNFDDLLSLAQNYGLSALSQGQEALLGDTFLSDFALAMSMVPEPASVSLIFAGSSLCRRRRQA